MCGGEGDVFQMLILLTDCALFKKWRRGEEERRGMDAGARLKGPALVG